VSEGYGLVLLHFFIILTSAFSCLTTIQPAAGTDLSFIASAVNRTAYSPRLSRILPHHTILLFGTQTPISRSGKGPTAKGWRVGLIPLDSGKLVCAPSVPNHINNYSPYLGANLQCLLNMNVRHRELISIKCELPSRGGKFHAA